MAGQASNPQVNSLAQVSFLDGSSLVEPPLRTRYDLLFGNELFTGCSRIHETTKDRVSRSSLSARRPGCASCRGCLQYWCRRRRPKSYRPQRRTHRHRARGLACHGGVSTYGNFSGAHVFRSIDNGETWRSLDGSGPTGLPDIPAHSIVVDPDDRQRLYLGTDLGVMVSIDGGQTWMTEETGFGPAVTMWLSLIRTPAGQKQLFAFTHGRGVWRVTLR